MILPKALDSISNTSIQEGVLVGERTAGRCLRQMGWSGLQYGFSEIMPIPVLRLFGVLGLGLRRR